MPRVQSVENFFNFSGGLNTEASGANYPDNAATELVNMNVDPSGVVYRRRGLVLDDPAVGSIGNFSTNHWRTFRWKNAGNIAGQDILVAGTAATLNFYKLDGTDSEVDFLNTASPTNGDETAPFEMANVAGHLIVTQPEMGDSAYLIRYNGSTSFTSQTIFLQQRDFDGINEGVPVDDNPATLAVNHEYNLLNQGWDSTKYNQYNTTVGDYPSNAEVWHVAKNATTNAFGATEATNLSNFNFGTTPAPRGHYILSVSKMNAERESASGVSTISDTDEYDSPSAVASYASRAFYFCNAKIDLPPRLFFSQLLDTSYETSIPERVVACYQKNDPTSDTFNQLLATDGGSVPMPETGYVRSMIQFQGALLIFAENGIWSVSGGRAPFTADNFLVNKVSNQGCISGASVVDAGSAGIFYWSTEGINQIAYDSENFVFVTSSITNEKINTLYNTIDEDNQIAAQGTYDPTQNKIMWFYKDDQFTGTDEPVILIYDTQTKAFSQYSINDDQPSMGKWPVAVASVPRKTIPQIAEVDNTLVNSVQNSYPAVKIIFRDDTDLTMGTFTGDFDVDDHDGSTYTSKILTGYKHFGDMARDKDVLYMTTAFNRTETAFVSDALVNRSSCLGKVYFDWSDGSDNRFSPQQELYRLRGTWIPAAGPFNYGKNIVTTKTKIRGSGITMQFEFLGQSGYDMQLVGWSMDISGNVRV